VECVKELDDPDYLQALITEMLTVVEKKAQDVENMCETMVFLNSEQLLSKEHYVKAFKQFMEGYDDLTIDVPQAPTYVAQLLKAASVNPQEVGGDDHISLQKAYQRL
jgi:translation initiation factor 4G